MMMVMMMMVMVVMMMMMTMMMMMFFPAKAPTVIPSWRSQIIWRLFWVFSTAHLALSQGLLRIRVLVLEQDSRRLLDAAVRVDGHDWPWHPATWMSKSTGLTWLEWTLKLITGNWFIVFSRVSPRTYVYIFIYIYIYPSNCALWGKASALTVHEWTSSTYHFTQVRGTCLQMQSNLIHDMNLHGCVGIVRNVCLLVNTPMTSDDYKLQLTGPCWHVIMSCCVATMRLMWMILKMMILNMNWWWLLYVIQYEIYNTYISTYHICISIDILISTIVIVQSFPSPRRSSNFTSLTTLGLWMMWEVDEVSPARGGSQDGV